MHLHKIECIKSDILFDKNDKESGKNDAKEYFINLPRLIRYI